MKKLAYIGRLVKAVWLLLLLAVAPAVAQNVVFEGEITTLSVEQMEGDTYLWELYNDSMVNFAIAVGTAVADGDADFVDTNTGSIVHVKWKEPGIYFFKVTAYDKDKCAMNLKIGKIKVIAAKPTAIITSPNPDWICMGDSLSLEIIFTGIGPWEFTYTDGQKKESLQAVKSPFVLRVSPKEQTTYWITSVKDHLGNGNDETLDPEKIVISVYNKPRSSKIYLKKQNE